MIRVINNRNMFNCVHFKEVVGKACCGRRRVVGFCTIPSSDGKVRNKACSTQMSYCKFQSKTIDAN